MQKKLRFLVMTTMLVMGGSTLLAQDRGQVPPSHAQPAQVELITPQGDYAQVRLTFAGTGGEAAESWTCMGTLRDGRVRIDHVVGLREPGGVLDLKNDKLTGTFTRVIGLKPSRMVQVAVDADVKENSISATCTIDGAPGTVTGTITPEAQLSNANSIPQDNHWPAFLGPTNSTASALPTSAPLVNSLADMQLVWRSEEPIPQALGPLSRFMDKWPDASRLRTGGGGFSPVLYEGKVFAAYFVPSPERIDQAAAARLKESAPPEHQENLPGYALEKVYASADEVVVAMDAATGKTLWKSVVKGRGINIQHHKFGPFNLSPAAGQGRIFAIGSSGFMYAFDAANGKLLWDVKVAADTPQHVFLGAMGPSSSYTPMVFNDVVVAPNHGKWAGYDAATGKLLWTDSRGADHSSVNRWVNGDKDYVLLATGRGGRAGVLACLDPRSGQERWSQPILIVSDGRGRGPGGLSVFGDILVTLRRELPEAGQEEAKPTGRITTAWKLSPEKLTHLWDVPVRDIPNQPSGECVPVLARGKYVVTLDLQVIDLATGKVTGQGDAVLPQNGGYMQAMDDLVLVRRDGTHGKIEIGAYRISADGVPTALDEGQVWQPGIGGSTTSYHHPIYYPAVDGRLFIRQYDGIYCYDLRGK